MFYLLLCTLLVPPLRRFFPAISIMSSQDESDPKMWPPGTVRLEDILKSQGEDIILQPQPSDDPNDPLNWSRLRKYWNFALVSFYALMVFALIDAATPTWGPMNLQLGFSYPILNDSYAIGCGTLAFGAFLLIPFALKYGRRPIYILSTIIQFAVSIWSAKLETVADLMLVNAISCGVGALAEVIVQVSVIPRCSETLRHPHFQILTLRNADITAFR